MFSRDSWWGILSLDKFKDNYSMEWILIESQYAIWEGTPDKIIIVIIIVGSRGLKRDSKQPR